jgi:hypothetical protein
MTSLDGAATDSKQAAAQTIANFFASIVATGSGLERTGYSHMGATLTDTVLQAGVNYRSVVLPRVQHILHVYPQAGTTSGFWQLLRDVGPGTVLRWSHPEKIERLNRLVDLLLTKKLETEFDVATWFCSDTAATELLAIKGVGPKTVDYLKILVGIPSIAVDRHVKTLFRIVGLEYRDYDDFKSVMYHAAEILNVQPQILDGVIWQYVSVRSQKWNAQIRGTIQMKPSA